MTDDLGPFAEPPRPTYVTVGGGSGQRVEVPRALNFVWLGGAALRLSARENIRAWLERAADTGWQVRLWSDQDALAANRDFLAEHFPGGPAELRMVTPEVFDAHGTGRDQRKVYDFAITHRGYAMASDILRYAVLGAGGAHIDVDIHPGRIELPREPLRMPVGTDAVPFLAPMLPEQRDVEKARIHLAPNGERLSGPGLLEQAARLNYEYGRFNTSMIIAPPGSPFLARIYHSIPERVRDQMPDPQYDLRKYAGHYTGPNLWHEEISRLKGSLRERHQQRLRLGWSVGTGYRPRVDPALENQWAGLGWVTPESNERETGTSAAFFDDAFWQDLLERAPVEHREHLWADPASGVEQPSEFDVRRVERDGQRLTELTVTIAINPDEGVGPAQVTDVWRRLRLGIYDHFNAHGNRLPNGDLLRVRAVPAHADEHAHLTVDLYADGDEMTQHKWVAGQKNLAMYAHELARQLGLRDEYAGQDSTGRSNAPPTCREACSEDSTRTLWRVCHHAACANATWHSSPPTSARSSRTQALHQQPRPIHPRCARETAQKNSTAPRRVRTRRHRTCAPQEGFSGRPMRRSTTQQHYAPMC